MPFGARVVSALALALVLGACGGRTAITEDPFGGGPETVNIHVTNLNFNEARLWALSNSGRQRIGVVGGKADAVYRIPWDFSQPLQVEIDILAGPRCFTDTLVVDPGDELELQIETAPERLYRCS